MGKADFDMDIKEKLKEEIALPKGVEDSLEEAYRKIRQGEVRMKNLDGYRRRKKRYRSLGIAAAAACIVLALTGVLYVNPALAKDIPIIGDVFARIQELRDSRPYPEKDKTAYQNIAAHAEPVTEPSNIAESEGITMSVSDAYCDGYDLYYTLSLQTEDEEMKQADYLNILKYKEGSPIPRFWDITTIGGEDVSSVVSLEKSDEGVFVALARIESMALDAGVFPENMVVKMDVDAISACKRDGETDPDIPYSGRLGYKSVKGDWQLEFSPKMDTTNNRTTALNAENNGFIVKEVTQTPSNTHITLYMPAEWAEKNPAVILTDTDGNRVYEESAMNVEQEDGGWIRKLVFNHSEADQFHMKIYDKNGVRAENGLPPLLAEIPFSMK